MDIFSHGLWAGAVVKGVNLKSRKPLNFWQTVFWGIFPDLFAFIVPFIWLLWAIVFGGFDFRHIPFHRAGEEEPPAYNGFWAFRLAQNLYNISHSLIIFLLIFLIIWFFLKRPYWELGGWFLHIVIDIPTHSYKFFPTPFLWPISGLEFDGFSWGHPWFLILNYSAIIIVYILLCKKKNNLPPMKHNKEIQAFTLVEMVIVLAVVVVIVGLTTGIGYNFYSNQSLVSERDNLVSLLRNARSMAIVNTNQSNYGVFIDAANSNYIVFQGGSYAARNTAFDTSFSKSSSVKVDGPLEIVFNALDGSSSVSGTITLSTSLGNVGTSVNSEGRINW